MVTNDALAAKKATKTIPIVFTERCPILLRLGLIDSLARPGGNLTGFTAMARCLAGKRLELLKETIPKLSRVAVLVESQSLRRCSHNGKKVKLAARELGFAAALHGDQQR